VKAVHMKKAFLAALGLLGLGALLSSVPAAASQSEIHVVEGLRDLLKGDLDGTAVGPDGVVRVGPAVKVLGDGLTGPVLAVTRGGDGAVYAATAAPGRVWRIVDGKAPEAILDLEKPLVTALLPVGKGKLVALTAPEGGAEVIDLATRKAQSIPAKDAKLLLAGTVLDDVVYAVGGGEEGVLLKLAPGAKAFEVVARTKEAQLRSVAAAKVGGAVKIVVGGGDDGVVYEVNGGKVRALVDANPGEVSALAIGADGSVYAAAVDGEGKLSKGATAKVKEGDDDDKDKKRPKPKARKVKSAEIWRIDPRGRATLLWQSKDHGAYALALVDGRLLAGTGPEGRIYQIDPAGGQPAGVLLRMKDRDEVTSLRAEAGGLLFGTAHTAAVVQASKLSDRTAAKGATYLSKALDANALSRYGAVVARGRGDIKLSVRTGNTKEPDDTWSAWTASPAEAPAGQYAQVRAVLAAGAALEGLSLSYLNDNRAPEIDRVEVLAPGWKVVATHRDQPETRSVTFNEKPFARYLDRRGGQNPKLEERPFGKQSFDAGYRTVYAYVEDPDKDALRYRFSLGKVGPDGNVKTWSPMKAWSEEPFVSFEASRLADGEYRVKVEVDDLPTNGPARKLGDVETSPVFVVSHAAPRLSGAQATRAPAKGTVRVKLEVAAALPLTVVRCSANGGEWMPLDPRDGIIDGKSESFDVEMEAGAAGALNAVSCEVYDEALNFNRIDIPVTG
jgi:hypothetical protein